MSHESPASDPHSEDESVFQRAQRAAEAIADRSGRTTHDVAVVLGSGWADACQSLGDADWEAPTHELPHFAASSVPGHVGLVRSVTHGDRRLLVFVGRTHLYENHGVDAVAHPVRTAAAAGCSSIIFTNGAGSLNPSWGPGTPVLISDHINFTAQSPLHGPAFIDVTDLYSPRLRQLCTSIDAELQEGVYLQFRGPSYETPAEIRMARAMGADLVGMSTAVEAIAARQAGLEILGISLVTNLAAGMTGAALSHQEVLDNGARASHRIGALLSEVVDRI